MNEHTDFIESLQKIEIIKPTDLIIRQIKQQISTGVLKPGDLLPPEREIAKRLNVGRGYIREAIKKLEFYGILKTIPHKGTIVSSMGVRALEGLIANILELEKSDIISLVETRLILEINSARLATERASDAEIDEIAAINDEYCKAAEQGRPNIEIDFLFHLRIAEFCKNPVLRSLISLITPDVISLSKRVLSDPEQYIHLSRLVMGEHEKIVEGIRSRDPEKAAAAMSGHLQRVLKLVSDFKTTQGQINIVDWIEKYQHYTPS